VKSTEKAAEEARPYEPARVTGLRRITAAAIKNRKGKTVFPMVTAYDAAFARIVEDAGIDYILVGDSLGNVVLGYDETTPVTVDEMIHHAKAVARATARAHVVVDMPFGSYHVSDEDALRNAIRIVKETGASSVKVEGGVHEAERVRAIARAGIPVVGHIGITPQTASLGPGYKKRTNVERLIADAKAIEAAGAYAIVLEVIDDHITQRITELLTIPTIGIGSGPHCDSQVLVLYDLLGMYPHAPSFVKRYGEIGQAAFDALRAYAGDVRERRFP
jgi:3-methyl-2-oxobutanoate hydroxymethyltransferase